MKSSDYFRFLKYFIPKKYPIIVIAINKINAIFIGVLIPASKRNTLKQSKRIHKVKRTATACPGVLTGGATTTISQNKNHLFCFNVFGCGNYCAKHKVAR